MATLTATQERIKGTTNNGEQEFLDVLISELQYKNISRGGGGFRGGAFHDSFSFGLKDGRNFYFRSTKFISLDEEAWYKFLDEKGVPNGMSQAAKKDLKKSVIFIVFVLLGIALFLLLDPNTWRH